MGVLKVGTRVRVTADYLRSRGIFTGALPFAKGVITRLEPFGTGRVVCDVKWTNDYLGEIGMTRFIDINLEAI